LDPCLLNALSDRVDQQRVAILARKRPQGFGGKHPFDAGKVSEG
jgi:hypothetical protein